MSSSRDLDVVTGSRMERRIFWFENVTSDGGPIAFEEHRIDITPEAVVTGFNMGVDHPGHAHEDAAQPPRTVVRARAGDSGGGAHARRRPESAGVPGQGRQAARRQDAAPAAPPSSPTELSWNWASCCQTRTPFSSGRSRKSPAAPTRRNHQGAGTQRGAATSGDGPRVRSLRRERAGSSVHGGLNTGHWAPATRISTQSDATPRRCVRNGDAGRRMSVHLQCRWRRRPHPASPGRPSRG